MRAERFWSVDAGEPSRPGRYAVGLDPSLDPDAQSTCPPRPRQPKREITKAWTWPSSYGDDLRRYPSLSVEAELDHVAYQPELSGRTATQADVREHT